MRDTRTCVCHRRLRMQLQDTFLHCANCGIRSGSGADECACRPAAGSHNAGCRRGITLLEVIISVAIFLGGLAAVMQGLAIGQRSELSARLQSEAVLRCEAVIGEIVCGAAEASSSQGNRFPDDEIGNWEWNAEVTEGGATGLLQITVVVEHKPDGGEPNAAFTLVRYMRDPQLFLDAALQESGQ